MKKHRILCLQQTSVFEQYGGIEYYLDDFLSLASELLGPDEVHALVPQRSPLFVVPNRPYQVTSVAFSTNVWRKRIENRFSVAYISKALEIIKKFQPTLLLCGHVSLGPVAYALHQITKTPIITMAYGIEAWGNLWPQDEWSLKQTTGIISISHWTKKILVERGFEGKKIQIVHPALAKKFEDLPYQEREVNAKEPFRLLTISRLDAQEQYKGQDHVLHALSEVRKTNPELELKYTIQGEGTDLPRLEALAETLKLKDTVTFLPPVKDRDALERIYRGADLFVMPSRYGRWGGRWRGEGFGIVYVEAAAFGLPSLAYDCGGVTDIIRNEENGWLVPSDDTEALARQILFLAQNRKKVIEAGHRAYKTVHAKFTREPIRKELAATLESL